MTGDPARFAMPDERALGLIQLAFLTRRRPGSRPGAAGGIAARSSWMGGWILRFSKSAGSAPLLARKLRLLPVVAPLLPVEVPRHEWIGRPSADYPCRFGGYRKPPGVPRLGIPTGGIDPDDLAAVHVGLRAVPGEVAAGLGMVELAAFDDIPGLRGHALTELEQVRDELPAAVVERCRGWLDRAGADLPPDPGPPHVLHGDRVIDRRAGLDDPGPRERAGSYGVATAIGGPANGLVAGRPANRR